ncbi:putative oxidoreductase, aryl-alcohol dehydrogenase like protein [Candidatus Nitrososphaera evergladensis SR1]|uniref:Putative oxidoreductase, aryl-alcohol dehydrogenase like protein n=1 Tax=Candidatus Nitrososphaera evergladensis SR1 TaxID=1459636 RepID=A0A075MS89_9ARCH|nr:putative oxidoreductase, aryl-alcohol dehydrogenase like protein [Candidatus Nitrososphaera evergladensis SR1]
MLPSGEHTFIIAAGDRKCVSSSAADFKVIEGHATPEGTKKYASYGVSKKGLPATHFREFDGLYLSSIGMGTYLGDLTKEDDIAVENAVYESVMSGAINVIDTAINYRAMKSEKSIGRALLRLASEGKISRDQIFISTKNGYITNDGDFPNVDVMEYMHRMYIANDVMTADDISSGYNVMNPNYLAKCIEKSLANMHLSTIDLVYIHNAFESWHEDVDRKTFAEMLAKVFELYEKYRKAGKLRYYGMATWTCFRVPKGEKEHFSLEDAVKIAREVGGDSHGFKFIQLPYNLAYSEALLLKNQPAGTDMITILEAAGKLGIGVFTSAPLFQGRLLRAQIPDYVGVGDNNKVAKLVQVLRSSPSVVAPLLGQKSPEHIRENIQVASIPPLTREEFAQAIDTLMNRPMS